MILCAGEILADMIGSGSDGRLTYERKAGGAPFNVACGINKFGGKVVFCGSVGDDLIGEFLYDYAVKTGMDASHIKKDKDRNTTLAFVQLDEHGERSFCFYRKDTADSHIDYVDDALLSGVDTVYIGSLMLSEPHGVKFAKELADRAHRAGKTVAFDVNFRTDIFRDEEGAVATYKQIIPLADVVKFSEDEVEIFTEKYLEEELKDKLLCISYGGKGSQWRLRGRRGNVKSIKVTPVDTTGAGDAFFAGVLTKLDGIKLEDMDEGVLNSAFAFGNVCGALNTFARGAIDNLPDLNQIASYLK